MVARITNADAKRLGIVLPDSATVRKRSPREPGLPTRCCTCNDEFPGPAAQDRHFAENPEHRRYEVVLTMKGTT